MRSENLEKLGVAYYDPRRRPLVARFFAQSVFLADYRIMGIYAHMYSSVPPHCLCYERCGARLPRIGDTSA